MLIKKPFNSTTFTEKIEEPKGIHGLAVIEDGNEKMNSTNYRFRQCGQKILMVIAVPALLVGLFFILSTVFSGKIYIIYLKLKQSTNNIREFLA